MAEAQVALTKLQRRMDQQQHPKSAITLREALEQWMEVADLQVTTRERYEDRVAEQDTRVQLRRLTAWTETMRGPFRWPPPSTVPDHPARLRPATSRPTLSTILVVGFHCGAAQARPGATPMTSSSPVAVWLDNPSSGRR
jgi:hypothetical protein